MSNKLDEALKLHFAHKDNVPQETRNALRGKLYAQEKEQRVKAAFRRPILNQFSKAQDKLSREWALALCAVLVLAAILILAATDMLFGRMVMLFVLTVYYSVAATGGAIIIFVLLFNSGSHKIRKVD
jgi:sterol desaturase/sphingolipid hydroxylase (fatty acid hydroxylase superfamily)